MPVKDCLVKYKKPHLIDKFTKLVEGGINEYQAAREIILGEHESLHNEMNDIRAKLGAKKVPFNKPPLPDTKIIAADYDSQIEEARKVSQPAKPKVRVSAEQVQAAQPEKPKVRVSAEQVKAAQPEKKVKAVKPKSDRQERLNRLRDKVDSFNKLDIDDKSKARALNNLRLEAEDVGRVKIDYHKGHAILRYNTDSGGRVQRRSSETNKTVLKDFEPTSYSERTQDAIDKIVANPSLLTGLALKGEDGYRFSEAQRANAIQSIKEGKPNAGAKAIYDFFENAEDGNVLIEDVVTGREALVPIESIFEAVDDTEFTVDDAEGFKNIMGEDSFLDVFSELFDNELNQEDENQPANVEGAATESSKEEPAEHTEEAEGDVSNAPVVEKPKAKELSQKLKQRLAPKQEVAEEQQPDENKKPGQFQVKSPNQSQDAIAADFIREEINNKTSEADIKQALIDNGYTDEAAQDLIDDTRDTRQISLGVIGQVGKWLKKLFGGKQNVFIAKDEAALMEKANEVTGNISFRQTNAVFETRDGNRIGFNYDTDKVARERFDISKLKKIGEGSDRVVFDMGNGLVLKVAKTARGLEQNIQEGNGYLEQRGIVPEVKERGLNYVVAENVEQAKGEVLKRKFTVEDDYTKEKNEVTLNQMLEEFSNFSQDQFDNRKGGIDDVLAKYGMVWIMSHDLIWGDFIRKQNWGWKDGKPIHLDGGTFGTVKATFGQYSGKKNLSDPEFRDIYNKSRALKKKYGDTDKFAMFHAARTPEQQAVADAQKEVDKANRQLKKAEDKIAGTQSQQAEMGEVKQGAMFGVNRDEAKAVLDPLRQNVREAQERLTEAKKNLPKESGQQGTLFMNPAGEILGFTANGKIYLNGAKLNPETPIHEAGHIWSEWAKDKAPNLYSRGMTLVEHSKYLADVKSNPFYQAEAAKLPAAEQEAYYKHEALASAIGDQGAKFVSETKKKGFVEWAKELWTQLATALGFKNITADELKNLTLEQFAKRAAVDILKANTVSRKSIEEKQINNIGANSEDALLDGVEHRRQVAQDVAVEDTAIQDKLRLELVQQDANGFIQDMKDFHGKSYLTKVLQAITGINKNKVTLDKILAVGIALENEIHNIKDGYTDNIYGVSRAEMNKVYAQVQKLNVENARTSSKALNTARTLYSNFEDTANNQLLTPDQIAQKDAMKDAATNEEKITEAADEHESGVRLTEAAKEAVEQKDERKPKRVTENSKVKAKLNDILTDLKDQLTKLDC